MATTIQPQYANLPRAQLAARIMAVPAGIALLGALAEFLWHGSGVAWTSGAGLSLFGCAALTLAALALAALRPGGLRTCLTVLVLIGGLLTALAAWFLESHLVLTAVLAMLLCWLLFILVAR
ncbi:MAG: hypothetical protein QM682_15600 [Paracoccus sp. (in: a-proteobacteria)]|uniref:hypothetical protein n=1 Tax=Paracoccus sp. TaxID=267 RepID=UPI0039E71EB0